MADSCGFRIRISDSSNILKGSPDLFDFSVKVNGKQKCYVFNQNDMPTASEDELVLLDKECATLAETLTSKQVGSNIEISLFKLTVCV